MFCPQCRQHWMPEELAHSRQKRWAPACCCPVCGVPLAVDRMAAEFPCSEQKGRVPALTIAELLRETATPGVSPIEEICRPGKIARRDDGVRRPLPKPGHGERPATTLLDNLVGFSTLAGIIVLLAVVSEHGFWTARSRPAAAALPDAPAAAAPAVRAAMDAPPFTPAFLGGWRRAGMADTEMTPGTRLRMALYVRKSDMVQMLTWAPTQTAAVSLWTQFRGSTPLVAESGGTANLPARGVRVAGRSYLEYAAAKGYDPRRAVPTAWHPLPAFYSLSWPAGQDVVSVQGDARAVKAFAASYRASAR